MAQMNRAANNGISLDANFFPSSSRSFLKLAHHFCIHPPSSGTSCHACPMACHVRRALFTGLILAESGGRSSRPPRHVELHPFEGLVSRRCNQDHSADWPTSAPCAADKCSVLSLASGMKIVWPLL